MSGKENDMSEREKEMLPDMLGAILNFDSDRKNYLMGFVDGLAAQQVIEKDVNSDEA